MGHRFEKFCLGMLIAFFLLARPAGAEEITLVVIANPASPIKALTPAQVMSLYTGRRDSAFDGISVVPLDQPHGSPLREAFYRAVTGQSETQIDAFWARLALSGGAAQPLRMSDSAAILKRVNTDPHAIGYIERREVTKDVTVICDIKVKN